MATLLDSPNVRLTISGAQGPIGIDLEEPITPGHYLVKAPGANNRKFLTATGTGADDGLRADLADEDGAENIGYGDRSVAEALEDYISVKDTRFAGGAVGDGVTDDTAAIQAAFDTVTFPYDDPTPTTSGATIYFPPGIYLVDGLLITNNESNNNGGFNGMRILAYGAILKAKPGTEKLLSVSTTSTTINISGVDIDGLQFDTRDATTDGVVALHFANAYRCQLRHLKFMRENDGVDRIDMLFEHTGSQIELHAIHASVIHILGDDYGPAQLVLTTMNFYGCSWNDMVIDKAWGLNFWGCVVHDPTVAAFKMSNCDTIHIEGGDYEGESVVVTDRTYLDFTDGNVKNVTSKGNRTSSLPVYSKGQCVDFYDFDRWSGPHVRTNSRGRVTVTTTATEIYSFGADPQISGTCYTDAVLHVFGNGPLGVFCDIVMITAGGVVRPRMDPDGAAAPARTYSFVAPGSVRLALASNTAQVKATALASAYQ